MAGFNSKTEMIAMSRCVVLLRAYNGGTAPARRDGDKAH
jgi:hypothetical protein